MNQFKTLLKVKVTKDKTFYIRANETEYNIKIEQAHVTDGVKSTEDLIDLNPSKYSVLKLSIAGGTCLAAVGSWISQLF
ncbi:MULTISPECIES: hypothetical protein [Bacillus cereus group]|jgi:hypothetical protein|uniref:hypothetical protein n=1 Tax=Bacillus cereus group TaxID=86661 RepID=UPI0018A7D207|nr:MULTISPECIES: hypothetical protein [Bacillus cereus group]MBF8118155.1 hypothetical protein [Bacillus cereus]